MIDVRDLRIGNYLECGGDLLEVICIYGDGHGGVVLRDLVSKNIKQEDESQFLQFINPIPITLEWLEKLGFEWTEKEYGIMSYKWFECDSTDYFITAYTKPMAFEIEAPNLFTEMRIDDCKHVHELQNIVYWNCRKHELSLGGEE